MICSLSLEDVRAVSAIIRLQGRARHHPREPRTAPTVRERGVSAAWRCTFTKCLGISGGHIARDLPEDSENCRDLPWWPGLAGSGFRCRRPGLITSRWRCSCGGPSEPGVTPRRRRHGGRWRCLAGAWRRCGAPGAAGGGPARGRAVVAGSRAGVRVGGRDAGEVAAGLADPGLHAIAGRIGSTWLCTPSLA